MKTSIESNQNNFAAPLLPKIQQPPGMSMGSLMVRLPRIFRNPLGFLTDCTIKYGDIVNFGGKIYLLNHPDFIEQVLVSTNRGFIKGINKGDPAKAPTLAGNGLVVSEGDFWLRQRRLAQPGFHRQRISAYAETMVAYTERMLGNWQAGQTRKLNKDMSQLTLEIVARTLFNSDLKAHTDVISTVLEVAMESLTNPLMMLPIPSPRKRRSRQALVEFDQALYSIIAEREASGEDKGDLLSMFLAARDEDGSRMSAKQVRDELITMVIGGHETTSLNLVWTWYLLAQHAEVDQKLFDELQEVLKGRPPTMADLPQLRYTDAVIKETLRLFPPVWGMSREVMEPTIIGGYPVKKGARIILSQWVTQRDPRFYTHPEEFRPERWLDDQQKSQPKYAYFPFGGGPRVCIGQQFASMEATMLLASVAQRFRLELASNQPVKPAIGVTLRPKGGLQVILHNR